jgi:uncharacterized membrane protein YccC
MAKKKDAAAAAAPGGTGLHLSGHPRARRHIALAKGWGGLGAFLLVLLLSSRAGLPLTDAVLRGMLGGLLGYLVGWMLSVSIWRHLAVAEIEQGRQNLIVALDQQLRAAAQRGDRPGE